MSNAPHHITRIHSLVHYVAELEEYAAKLRVSLAEAAPDAPILEEIVPTYSPAPYVPGQEA